MNSRKYFSSLAIGTLLSLCLSSCIYQIESRQMSEKNDLPNEKSDTFYHYSIWWAFVNRVFDGELTASVLKSKGDLALGSFDLLDGELIMLDGVLYRATEDGQVSIVNDDSKIAYVNAAFFDADQTFTIDRAKDYAELRHKINEELKSKNIFYAFKIHGDFVKMTCGGLHKQEPPFEKGLDYLIPNRPIFEREYFSGTMVGFYCPEYIGNINVAAYHLHFVSDDQRFAGHVMEFEGENLTVEIDHMYEYQFVLPRSEAFVNGTFESEFQYQKR